MKKVRNFLNGHQVSVFCVDISRDEKKVISGDQKGIILLWSVKEYKQIIAFESHSSDIYSVKFSNNGDYAVSGGLDKKVIVWDIAKMILHASFDDHRECIEKVFFTEDDKSVIAAGNFYGIHVWSIVEKVEINAFKSAEDSEEWLNQHKLLKSELLRYLV